MEDIWGVITGDVVIAGHTNPDGDAIGACMALGMALKKLGKSACVVLEDYNARFDVIPGRELLYAGDISRLSPDTFIAVDCGSEKRLGAAEALLKTAANTVNIDHHMNNTRFAAVNCVDAQASSASELVFRILDGRVELNADIAAALYAGIVCDTGGFRHNSATGQTMSVAGRLMGYGIPFTGIYNGLMYTRSLAETKAMGIAIANLELYSDGRIAYTFITADGLERVGAAASDLGGVCEYMLNITGVQAAVFIYSKPGGYKISMRSKAAPVNTIAERLGGGGHRLAAGCDFNGTLEQGRDMVLEMLRGMI